jgi:hypothetical protein
MIVMVPKRRFSTRIKVLTWSLTSRTAFSAAPFA